MSSNSPVTKLSSTSLATGFGHHYRPTRQRVLDAFTHGVIALDTNVLLNVLRYTPAARRDLLKVFRDIAERCFIPHQVALEYNRNRVKAVAERRDELEAVTEKVGAIKRDVKGLVTGFEKRSTLRASDVRVLTSAVDAFVSALEEAERSAFDQYDLNPDRMVGQVDEWTAQLQEIFDGRVAPQPSGEIRAVDVNEATRRHQEKVAPGYKDQNQGDYLWWAEALRFPELRGKPLLVVSDDIGKGDWLYEERGFSIGPYPVLIDDVAKAGGTDLVLLTTENLLELVGEANPEQSVSGDTIDESKKVLASRAVTWTRVAFEQLLFELRDEGYADRADVIMKASEYGGFIPREDVYGTIGQDEDDRSLRHFATPVVRLQGRFVRAGVLGSGAADALVAVYEGAGKTTGYQVPPEFADFYFDDLEPDPDASPGGKDWD